MGERASRPERGSRRSYGHFCGLARALDQVGDRWGLLVIRELLAGPRRYTDLHADLPGVSTDMLAGRLRDLEADGVVERRRLEAPASGTVYALTARGRDLLPALSALAAWGAADLDARRSTDAVRVYWHALPLREVLRGAGVTGTVDVVTDEGTFHVLLGDPAEAQGVYGAGPAEPAADGRLCLDVAELTALCRGEDDLAAATTAGRVTTSGLRMPGPHAPDDAQAAAV